LIVILLYHHLDLTLCDDISIKVVNNIYTVFNANFYLILRVFQ